MAPRRRKPTGKGKRQFPRALPLIEGPKLGLFKHHDQPIEWLGKLGGMDEGEAEPAQSCVFRARICGQEYAVKVFHWYFPEDEKYGWEDDLDIDLDTAAAYFDPFYKECRAYGRIKERVDKGKLKPDIVVPAHGFLFLREEDKAVLIKEWYMDLSWAGWEPHKRERLHYTMEARSRYQERTLGGWRARAIVKDLVTGGDGVAGSLESILRDIKALRKCGIFNEDIQKANFRRGKLVDFGMAWTTPYPPYNTGLGDRQVFTMFADMQKFDEMVEDDDEIPNPTFIRATHPMRLRGRGLGWPTPAPQPRVPK